MSKEISTGCGWLTAVVILVIVLVQDIMVPNEKKDAAERYRSSHPAQSKRSVRKTVVSHPKGVFREVERSSDDAYTEGYDKGYADGYADGYDGRSQGYRFHDGSDYTGELSARFAEGYDEGYNDGYYLGEAEYDDEYEAFRHDSIMAPRNYRWKSFSKERHRYTRTYRSLR